MLVAAGLLILALGFVTQEVTATVREFAASDVARRRQVLNDIATSRARVPIRDVIALTRAGMQDTSADVRIAALAAVMGRATTSGGAGSAGGDRALLRENLPPECLRLLWSDSDARVRHYALLAIGNMERPARADEPFPDSFVTLLLDLYRRGQDARIRAEVLKTFRLIPNTSEAIRVAMRDGLVDSSEIVREEALKGVSPQVVGGVSKVSFEDARQTITEALGATDSDVRVAAVRALNVFGAPAAPLVVVLESLRRSDPDPRVRRSAQLAIEAIGRAVRERSGKRGQRTSAT